MEIRVSSFSKCLPPVPRWEQAQLAGTVLNSPMKANRGGNISLPGESELPPERGLKSSPRAGSQDPWFQLSGAVGGTRDEWHTIPGYCTNPWLEEAQGTVA